MDVLRGRYVADLQRNKIFAQHIRGRRPEHLLPVFSRSLSHIITTLYFLYMIQKTIQVAKTGNGCTLGTVFTAW